MPSPDGRAEVAPPSWDGPVGEALRAWLEGAPAEEPMQWLRQVPGRKTFAGQLPGSALVGAAEAIVVKCFEGRLAGDRWYRRFWNPDRRSPGQREWDSLLALGQRGLRVPRPIAWLANGQSSLVIMERVAHAETLRDALRANPSCWAHWRRELLRMVVRLHGAGGTIPAVHRDLYLQHLLVLPGPTPALCLIDVGRLMAGRGLRRRWLEKDLAALAHSCPDSIGTVPRLAWLGRYLRRLFPLDDRVTARQRLGRWARRVERRRSRMAAHRPRFGEEPTA